MTGFPRKDLGQNQGLGLSWATTGCKIQSMIHSQDVTDLDEGAEDPAILLAWLAKTTGWNCAECGIALCGHDRLRARALIGANTVRCLACMARRTQSDPSELESRLNGYIGRRECYAAAWASIDSSVCGHHLLTGAQPANPPPTAPAAAWSSANEKWDAGDLGCGDLVLPLRAKLRGLPPGTLLHLRATDPAAPVDLSAWCRLTGHLLVASAPPEYLIQRRNGD